MGNIQGCVETRAFNMEQTSSHGLEWKKWTFFIDDDDNDL